MIRTSLIALLLGSGLLLHTAPLGGSDKLMIRVSPAVASYPALLTVRANVEADEGNRSLEIIAESADFYRSSQIQLNGKNGPNVAVFEFPRLPAGTYEISGVLTGPSGRRASMSQRVQIVQSFHNR